MTEERTETLENPLYTLPAAVMGELALMAKSFVPFAAQEELQVAVAFKSETDRSDVTSSILEELLADYDDLPDEAKALCGDVSMLKQNLTLAGASAFRSAMEMAKARIEMDRVQVHMDEHEREMQLEAARENMHSLLADTEEYGTEEGRKRREELERKLAEAKASGDPAKIAAAQEDLDRSDIQEARDRADRARAAGDKDTADKLDKEADAFEAKVARTDSRSAAYQAEQAAVAPAKPGEAQAITNSDQALLAELGVPVSDVGNENLMALSAPAAPAGPANAPAVGRA